MISQEVRSQYMATIGIECHVQLKTATKLFAGVGNDARDAAPNSLVSHICFGMPGALPVLNEKAVELASRAAFALNTPPQKVSAFDRKHYFYPDLPMGYQITQFNHPIIRDGYVVIEVDGEEQKVRIHEAHIEADAGKNTHPTGADYSLVDLNRAGTPLLEIVSEPDMHSPVEAKAYVRELFLLMKYAGVSDCDLYHGNMRFDVNVSVSKSNELGTRTETKNLNSFKSVEKAAEYEINRQITLLEKGDEVVQETRGWDEAKQKTVSQRGKEFAHDYRYMPDPDLPPIELDDAYILRVKEELPELPSVWRTNLRKAGVDEGQVEVLVESEVDDPAVTYKGVLEPFMGSPTDFRQIANWIVNIEIPLRTEHDVVLNNVDQRRTVYRDLQTLVHANKLSSSNAKKLLIDVLLMNDAPSSIEQYANEKGYIQVSNSEEIEAIVKSVMAANPQAVEDIKAGEMKAVGFLVGQVMKESKGKANPSMAQELIKKLI